MAVFPERRPDGGLDIAAAMGRAGWRGAAPNLLTATASAGPFAATRRVGQPDPFLARQLTDGVLHFLAADGAADSIPLDDVIDATVKVVRELGHPLLARFLPKCGRSMSRGPSRRMTGRRICEPRNKTGFCDFLTRSASIQDRRDAASADGGRLDRFYRGCARLGRPTSSPSTGQNTCCRRRPSPTDWVLSFSGCCQREWTAGRRQPEFIRAAGLGRRRKRAIVRSAERPNDVHLRRQIGGHDGRKFAFVRPESDVSVEWHLGAARF